MSCEAWRGSSLSDITPRQSLLFDPPEVATQRTQALLPTAWHCTEVMTINRKKAQQKKQKKKKKKTTQRAADLSDFCMS